jgi:hypothetical protein
MAEKSLNVGCVWAILEGLKAQSKIVVRASDENNILKVFPFFIFIRWLSKSAEVRAPPIIGLNRLLF